MNARSDDVTSDARDEGSVPEIGALPSAPAFDPAEYREELKALDISDAEAEEFLAILWDILRSFVEIGFGVDSVSAVLPDAFGVQSKSTSAETAPNVKCASTDKILNERPVRKLTGEKDSKV